jgi:DNA-binding GntR family transcriptional regulator
MADNIVGIRDRVSRRQQLPEEVASYVRELIISAQVEPGEFLRIERIAEQLGVSNTPVREGLLALRSDGFVQLVPRRGFVVAPFTRQDVQDLFWAQAQLAQRLAARAAKKITPERVARLEANLEEFQAAATAGDEERIAGLGHAFHREINLAADSLRLALLLGSVVNHLPNRFYASIEAQVAATSDEHPQLVEALREHDERKAQVLMEHHILGGADHLIEILEERGLWASGDRRPGIRRPGPSGRLTLWARSRSGGQGLMSKRRSPSWLRWWRSSGGRRADASGSPG